MKNVLVLGCSWSRAFSLSDDKHTLLSWPQYFYQATGHRVWNFSAYCHSLEAQSVTLNHLLQHHADEIDLVILQYTTSNRMTMVRDWNDYCKKLTTYFLQQTDPSMENYTEYPEEQVKTSGTWNGMGACHMNPGTVPRRWRKCFEDQLVYGLGVVGQQNDYFATVLRQDMRRLVHSYNIPCIAYMHIFNHGYTVEQAHTSHQYDRDRTYTDFILQFDMPGFDDYVIDNGYHFGAEGNNALVQNMILPRLREIIHD